jgi:hypothetical protein
MTVWLREVMREVASRCENIAPLGQVGQELVKDGIVLRRREEKFVYAQRDERLFGG